MWLSYPFCKVNDIAFPSSFPSSFHSGRFILTFFLFTLSSLINEYNAKPGPGRLYVFNPASLLPIISPKEKRHLSSQMSLTSARQRQSRLPYCTGIYLSGYSSIASIHCFAIALSFCNPCPECGSSKYR